MRRNLLAPGLLCVSLATCTLPAALGQTNEDAQAESQIRRALDHWVEAANRQDWKAALDVWAPDLIGWYPGQPEITYPQEVANASRPPSSRTTTYQVKVNEVIVSGSLAVLRDTWVFTSHTSSGDSTEKVRSFEIWRRQPDGAWRISRWISAPEPPAPK
jgi:ketosteroid isomerase-like protein